jgi:hypothetical protein
MSHPPDDSDIERSYELERQLDRDHEREPSRTRVRRHRRQFRYWVGISFPPTQTTHTNEVA